MRFYLPTYLPGLTCGSALKNLPSIKSCMGLGLDPWTRKTPWRSAWQPTPVFLPGESHGQVMGSQRVGHNWSDLAHMHVHFILFFPVVIFWNFISQLCYWHWYHPHTQIFPENFFQKSEKIQILLLLTYGPMCIFSSLYYFIRILSTISQETVPIKRIPPVTLLEFTSTYQSPAILFTVKRNESFISKFCNFKNVV